MTAAHHSLMTKAAIQEQIGSVIKISLKFATFPLIVLFFIAQQPQENP
jgi:hypothetical protein